MPITGTANDDDIQLNSPISDDVDLGDGNDTIRLADGSNVAFVSNTETVVGGAGNDLVIENGPGLTYFNGGSGFDQLQLGSSPNPITVQSVERVFGGAEVSDITYQFPPNPTDGFPAFYLGAGYDTVRFDNGTGVQQSATLSEVEELSVVRGSVDVSLVTKAEAFKLSTAQGAETVLTLGYVAPTGGVSNQVIAQGRNTIIGSSGQDVVDVVDATLTTVVGGGSEDIVRTSAIGSNLVLTDIASVEGGSGDDRVVLTLTEGQQYYARDVSLGEGRDSLQIRNEASSTTTVYVSGAETISVVGNTGLYLQDRAFNSLVTAEPDSNARIVLGDFGGFKTANLLEVDGSVTVIGSEGRDVVRAQAGEEGSVYALGGGLDRLEMIGAGAHVATVIGVEAVVGGTGNDTLIIEEDTPDTMSIDLGAGLDKLYLSEAGGSVLVSNVEQVFGKAGQDTVVVRTNARAMEIDLGDGYDSLSLGAINNSLVIRNTEFVVGGAGVDRITVADGDTTSVFVNAREGGDVLIGGAGNDTFIGGLGKDLMTGGAGADTFLFEKIADSDLNTRDIIYDFTPGQDKLEFQGLLSGKFELTVEQVFTAFQANGNSQAHFIDATDQLLIDSNGDGQMDMRMALLGVDGSQLTIGDFIWSPPLGGPPGGGGGPFD